MAKLTNAQLWALTRATERRSGEIPAWASKVSKRTMLDRGLIDESGKITEAGRAALASLPQSSAPDNPAT